VVERSEARPESAEEIAGALAPQVSNLVAARLRRGTRAVRRYAPSGRSLRRDAVAGLTGAVCGVPDGMASGVLAGVNPIYGLYASLVGPVAGGLFTSTQLLRVTTTSAAAIAVGESIAGLDDRVRDQLFRSGRVNASGPLDVYPETSTIGEANRRAVADAEAWLVARRTPPPSG
jgi:hypothetical protein